MNKHEVLVRARNVLSTGGVIARRQADHEGGHCAIGAIGFAVDGCDGAGGYADGVGAEACIVLRKANAINDRDITSPVGGIAYWNNDLVDLDKSDDVIAGFDKAIAATAPEPDTSFLSEVEEAIPA